MARLLIISFDAVGDDEFERLMKLPNFHKLAKKSKAVRGIKPPFLSNTYPIHASVMTGAMPREHGIRSNIKPFPCQEPVWNTNAFAFRKKPLWQIAFEHRLTSAAVLWPVTAGSPHIRYNIPEVIAQPGESQILTSLKAGSKLLQMKMFLKYGRLLKGIQQPQLDRFATACMTDILKAKKPDLALMHLTCYDTLCHKYGKDAPILKKALKSLDHALGELLLAAGTDTSVILFTDHSQKAVHTSIAPNDLLYDLGYLQKQGAKWRRGKEGCFFECCGGSTFFHKGRLSQREIDKVKELVEQQDWFERYLYQDELEESGYQNQAFGCCAKPGYSLDPFISEYRGQHGYPASYDNYDVFYMIADADNKAAQCSTGSLLDIKKAALKILGIDTAGSN